MSEINNINYNEGDLGDVGDCVVNKLMPVVPYPVEIFPQIFQKLIKEASNSLNVEQEVVAGSILTITSSAIGNTIRISPKTGWEVPPFLWFIIIAKSGDGKTPTARTFTEAVDLRQAETKQGYGKDLQKYIAGKKEKKDEISFKFQNEPRLTHYIVNDATIPALANVFESSPRGVLYYVDELSGLIKGFDQYKKGAGNDRQHYLQLFDAASWKIDRLDRSQYVPNTGMAIFGGIQPKVMPSVININTLEDGFISRFIFSFVAEKNMIFSNEIINLSAWEQHLDSCYKLPLTIDINGKVKPMILCFDEEALPIWVNFHDELGKIKLFLPDLAKIFIPKLITYSLKFAGILHVFNEFNENKSAISNIISVETTQQAIALTRYYLGQAGKVINLYVNVDHPLDEMTKHLLQVLCTIEKQVTKGLLPLSLIRDEYNNGIPDTIILPHDNRQLSAMVKSLGLQTKHGTGNVSNLVWEDEKLKTLFSKHISPTSPISSNLDAEICEKIGSEEYIHSNDVTDSNNLMV